MKNNILVKNKFLTAAIVALPLLVLLFVAGCSPNNTSHSVSTLTKESQGAQPVPPKESGNPDDQECKTADCFIVAANACNNMEVTINQSAGIFRYAITQPNSNQDSNPGSNPITACILNKTLLTLNAPKDIKKALEGKSMTCIYQKGAFDSRWVNNIMLGMEYCKGDLKNGLSWLLMLA